MKTVLKEVDCKISANEADQLTGLYNRRAGVSRLSKHIYEAKHKDQPFIAILLDINDLKDINDTYGHRVGDLVIKEIAMRIQGSLGPHDFAIRLSGDEVFVVYSEVTNVQVDKRITKISRELNEIDAPYAISFCYGLWEVRPNMEVTAKQIIMACDNAMYEWKRRYHIEKARSKGSYKPYMESEESKAFQYDKTLLFNSLMQSTDDYIYVCDMKDETGTFRYSKAMVEEFDLPSEIIPDAARIWGDKVHEADKQRFIEANQEISDGRVDVHNVEYRAKNRHGEWVWLRCRGHLERDLDGTPTLFAGMISKLGRKNKIDYLTGMFNKYELEDTVKKLLIDEKQEPFAMIILDLDEFSYINKLYNQEFGDAVLADIATRMQSVLPSNAKLFRNDSDEFTIILRYQDYEKDVEEVYGTIKAHLSTQKILNGKRYHCTASAGCVACPSDASDFLGLTKAARYAMESSKKTGMNRLTFFQKKMMVSEIRELDITEQLRYSIEHNFEGFHLHFQPQVDATSKKIIGAEALARWSCDMYGNVTPLEFIPLLEKSGMIINVGKWIFEEAVKKCKTWIKLIPHFKMSINISYLQLCEYNFVDFMKHTLEKKGVSPMNIVVEMTESYLVKSSTEITEMFKQIREVGIHIAMDDFGTGYSSLGVLKNSPADIVKIDKIFIKDILFSNFDVTFIHFVVKLCHDVNISVLLEGVETLEEYEKVKGMGLDFIQGYYFGRPLDSKAFEDLIH